MPCSISEQANLKIYLKRTQIDTNVKKVIKGKTLVNTSTFFDVKNYY